VNWWSQAARNSVSDGSHEEDSAVIDIARSEN
jgi:hypothetical protein